MAGRIGNAGQEFPLQSREQRVAGGGQLLRQLVRFSDDGPSGYSHGRRRDVQLPEKWKCIGTGGAGAAALRVRRLRDVRPGFLESEAESDRDLWTALFALLAPVGNEWAPGVAHGRFG